VILIDAMPGDPPARLRVAAVRLLEDALEITCRLDPSAPATGSVADPPRGQAIRVPATVLPIRVLIR
ncbi:MAG: hypothetical protein ACRD5D_09840, partial [Candidatus Polarisedimenticolia bacterium]